MLTQREVQLALTLSHSRDYTASSKFCFNQTHPGVSTVRCRDHASGMLSTVNVSNLHLAKKAADKSEKGRPQLTTLGKNLEATVRSRVLVAAFWNVSARNSQPLRAQKRTTGFCAAKLRSRLEQVRGGGATYTALGLHRENTTGKGGGRERVRTQNNHVRSSVQRYISTESGCVFEYGASGHSGLPPLFVWPSSVRCG